MLRLHAVMQDHVVEQAQASFVEPTAVHHWRNYLQAITDQFTPNYPLGRTLASNLAHRLQLLEFETALLLHHRDVANAPPGGSTLHVCVCCLKIHQHILLCHAILEGLGSHIVRFDAMERQRAIAANREIGAPQWRAAIVNTFFENELRDAKKSIRETLEELTYWRNRIHLDRIHPGQRMDYHVFTIAARFEPTYTIFRKVLTAMNAEWPADTCLNEEF